MINRILEFWFGSAENDAPTPPGAMARWFGGGPEMDLEVVRRFGPLLDDPAPVSDWAGPAGALAATLVLDQFPRNAFRGTARAFATDAAALRIASAAVSAGLDRALGPVQRTFLYLPWQHAEDLARQDEGVALYAALVAEAPDEALPRICLPFAEQHRAIVRRFGRFPGRNVALGRVDTPEEAAWLAEGGETFGQRR